MTNLMLIALLLVAIVSGAVVILSIVFAIELTQKEKDDGD